MDVLYVFQDKQPVQQESDTNDDGYFDQRNIYKNGKVVREEADTNKDRRVDVWIYYKDSKRVRQDEDLNFNGKIDARYLFKDGQVTEQKRVADLPPEEPAQEFSSIQKELSRKPRTTDSRPLDGELTAEPSLMGAAPVE